MNLAVLRPVVLVCALASSATGQVMEEPTPSLTGEEVPGTAAEGRCTSDGEICIGEATYAADVCRVIERAASAEGLDVEFFARLLWQESRFDAGAESPVGAQGIAQFMPRTAALRGLQDPFNPATAILASADYLKDLERRFGNLGLAAAAYNAGEDRVERFLAGLGGLPGETRHYVLVITDYPVEVWREGPVLLPDRAPETETSFQEACLMRAEGRAVPSLGRRLRPWAVTIVGRDTLEAVQAEAQRLKESFDDLLGDEHIAYTYSQYPGMQQPRHFAQVGRDTRVEAEALCQQLSDAGAGCVVRRNQ